MKIIASLMFSNIMTPVTNCHTSKCCVNMFSKQTCCFIDYMSKTCFADSNKITIKIDNFAALHSALLYNKQKNPNKHYASDVLQKKVTKF